MQKSKKLLSALMAFVMVLTAFPIMAFATNEVEKPNNGTTQSQPFVKDQPSGDYRIPGIVSLNDGTLVAVADARWGSGMDGGGNDVIVTRSTDGGSTWNYQLVNYFGDNGNVFNKSSTSFCDSAISTDGQNVYLLSTFFPAGYSINTSSANNRPVAESAFDNAGRLKLRLNGVATWDFYLDTNTKNRFGNYVIRRYSNNSITEDYSVDTEFCLHNASNGKSGSIFYNDGAFQTVKTTFLWFRSSNDGGITWNAPRLVNIKSGSDQFLGVGPGNAIVTSKGDIVFATYVYNEKTTLGFSDYNKSRDAQRTYLVSSSDGGYTWNITSGNATNDAWWSSEAAPVELPNGNIRVFLRSGGKRLVYSDAKRNEDGTYTWLLNHGVVLDGNGDEIDNYSDCQESAISYPYKVDGKDAIVVACPRQYDSRATGTIHLMTLNDDGTVDKLYRYEVTGQNVRFEYSSMTVLNNGDIGILYETSSGIVYRTIPLSTIAPSATASIPQTYDVTLAPGETYSFLTSSTESITNSSNSVATISTSDVEVAKARQGLNGTNPLDYNNGTVYTLNNALYNFQATSNGGYTISNARTGTQAFINIGTESGSRGAGYPQSNTAATTYIKTSPISGNDGSVFMLTGQGDYALVFGKGTNCNLDRRFDRYAGASTATSNNSALGCTPLDGAGCMLYRPVRPGETSSTEIPGFVKLKGVGEIEDGGQYLIVFNHNVYNDLFVVYPTLSQSDKFQHCAKVLPDETTVESRDVTVSALSLGTTKVQVGENLVYNVTVANMDSVTGAVKYDPVIYLQGSNFTEFGNNIAEGRAEGENKTTYQVAPGWSIQKIEIISGASSANVKASNGILTGTINVANSQSTDCYEKLLVKTYLIGPDGKTYLQQNNLFATCSPVPAHGVTTVQRWKSSYVVLSPMALIAKGSTSSYSTSGTSGNGSLANAVNMFTQNGMSVTKDSDSASYTTTGTKLGGYHVWSNAGGTGYGTNTLTTTATTGHYYYDVSSSYNPGFTNSNGKDFTFELVMNRPYVIGGSQCVVDGEHEKLDINQFSITLNGTTGNLIDNNTANSVNWINNGSTMGRFSFAQSSGNAYQTFAVSGSTNVDYGGSETINGNIYSYVSHGWYDSGWLGGTFWAVNQLTVPFQIHVENKSTVRTAYNNALTDNGSKDFDVLISSDYTRETWANYQMGMLNAEGWLNNYSYKQTTPAAKGDNLAQYYNNLTRVCDFTELDEILRAKKSLSEQYGGAEFPYGTSGYNVYTQSSWSNFQALYYNANRFANVLHAVVNPTSTPRPNLPGYTPGAHSITKNANQETIDKAVVDLTNYPIYAADPTNFEAAKALSKTLDLDAYNLVEQIGTEISSGDAEIYFEGKPENKIVDIPATNQKIIDDHTAALLNTMNVATDGEDENVPSNEYKGKVCNVTVHKYIDGEKKTLFSECYAYNTQLKINLNKIYLPNTTDPCISDSETATIVITNDNSTTTIPLTDDKVIPVLAASGKVDITITTTNKPAVVVYDYYGTILYSGFVNAKSDIDCNDAAQTVTIGGTVIDAKPSPSIKFDRWLIVTEDDGTYKVLQRGIRVGNDYNIVVAKGTNAEGNEVTIGTVTHFGETEPTETFSGLGRQYTVKAADTITPLVWKMSVYNENQPAHEYLAAYGSTFSRFTSNYNVIYTPIMDEDQLTAFGDAYGKPISYGDGYMSGDDKNGNGIPDKFTLGCSFSAPEEEGITIREAGVLYSTKGDLNADTMLKGAEGVAAKKQNKVSEYGTYTMTKTDADAGTHLMRSYVTYTTKELGATIIRVSYGPVYKCVDGQVSIVD